MLKFIKRFFSKSFDDAIQEAVAQRMSELDKDIGEKSIHLCKCGRKTLIKNHTKSIRKDGANIYSFHIVCPNCGAEVSAHAFRLEKAKSKAIDKWNKGEYKAKNDEIIQARKVGRPKMA